MPELYEISSPDDIHSRVMRLLAGAVDGGTVMTFEEQSHAETCLQCQAELLRYRKVLRVLHDLRTTVIRPTPGLLGDILENLAEKGEQRAIRSMITGKRAAYAGGFAVAAAAGVASIAIFAGRGRAKNSKPATKAA